MSVRRRVLSFRAFGRFGACGVAGDSSRFLRYLGELEELEFLVVEMLEWPELVTRVGLREMRGLVLEEVFGGNWSARGIQWLAAPTNGTL